jgi:hypothetical protein
MDETCGHTTIGVIDAIDPGCSDPTHRVGALFSTAEISMMPPNTIWRLPAEQ